jgi:hypothetical protein
VPKVELESIAINCAGPQLFLIDFIPANGLGHTVTATESISEQFEILVTLSRIQITRLVDVVLVVLT